MPAQAPPSQRVRIAVLAYDGCMPMQLFGMTDVLRIAADLDANLGNRRGMHLSAELVSVGGREVRLAGGMRLKPARPLGRYDVLIVPGLDARLGQEWGLSLTSLTAEVNHIRRSFSRGTMVASVCVGAFLLGSAGLLDGRQATTAWLFSTDLAARYPAARVDADSILIEDGGVITTGAVSSSFDLAVYLVKQFLGAEVATATANVALLPSQRLSQAPYMDSRLLKQDLPTFSENVRRWMADRIKDGFDLEMLAQAFHVSPRTLMRKVKAETGRTPLSLLQALRVDQAKHLLRTSRMSIEQVIESVGYSDPASFTRLFVRHVGETPAQYRRR